MIECEHKPIIDVFSKISDGGSTNQVQNLPVVVWADQSTVCTSTGRIPYYISSENKLVLLIELEIFTWQILPWNKVYSTANLLAMRIHQLQRRNKDLEETILYLQQIRLEEKKHHNDKHNICVE